MNFYWFDILQFTFFCVTCYGAYRFLKSKKYIWLLPLAIFVVLFVFSPVNMTEKNAAKKFTTTKEIPEKVTINKDLFEDKQTDKLNRLKKESAEKRDEEIN